MVEMICGWGMVTQAFEVREILAGGVMISTLDLTVASANRGVDGEVGLPIEVAGEAVGSLAARAGEAGRLAGILLEIGGLVHHTGFQE
ncbi:MAG: hypothetical protein A2W86_00680 [Bacteroidetes bacterium GWD2_45_23]|nr:MAG: hypothetical protein A2W87_05195 [Bacteroidetes bacterium GWC2_46_850]OFX85331.1 MAG: hypothetical protein A2W86_00680 [Bacteroidetes bacterium GWD2_45_23]HBB01003.1 hypothetical protein [Porphyromonadaceae bacterium]HCC17809.1 hypothetical protein [Porphyromonadaceae bacterium]